MFIVVYRLHNQLNIETQYIGPFASWDWAYEHLCDLPALGFHVPADDLDIPGCKFVQELTKPE